MVAVQVRDVPEEIRYELAREARTRGVSLQTYLLDVLEREARSAHNREFLRSWTPVRGTGAGRHLDVAALIAADRAERQQHVLDAVTGHSTE